jgi:putative hydrolase of HD superfamily
MPLDAYLTFIRELDQLKSVQRKSLTYTGERLENSAEHSWHLALAVMAFHPLVKAKVDLNKAVRFALLHDVVEIDAGDTLVYADQPEKTANEAAAAQRIFGLLPEGEEWRASWEEFEAKACPEAVYVNALDRFLPVYSNLLNEGHAWREHGVTFEQVWSRNRAAIEPVLPELWAHLAGLLERAAAAGHLPRAK